MFSDSQAQKKKKKKKKKKKWSVKSENLFRND